MKKYLKRIVLACMTLLVLTAVQGILNTDTAEAAVLGQLLTEPESGWTRYNDSDSRIAYDSSWCSYNNSPNVYGGDYHHNVYRGVGAVIKFEFYGSNVRLITWMASNNSGADVKVDNIDYGCFGSYMGSGGSYLFFEKIGLDKGLHKVEIRTVDRYTFSYVPGGNWFALDAIDIDSEGQLVSFSDAIPMVTLNLNKTIDHLEVGKSDDLIPQITPANASNKSLAWSSSNPSAVQVDSNGKITAVGRGAAVITASSIDGSRLKASCTVTAGDSYAEIEGAVSNVSIGDEFELDLNYVNKEDVSSIMTELQYDSSVLKMEGVKVYDGLRLLKSDITKGGAILNVKTAKKRTPIARKNIMKLKFKAVGKGKTNIGFKYVNVSNGRSIKVVDSLYCIGKDIKVS